MARDTNEALLEMARHEAKRSEYFVEIIKGLADGLCAGRLVLCLEGGYDLPALAASVRATFDVLLGNEVADPLGPPSHTSDVSGFDAILTRLKAVHGLA